MNRILIVDDEKASRDVLESFLTDEGYDIVTAANGQDAIETVKADSFSAVLTDIKMPGISGLKLTQLIRDHDESIPIILITGYASLETAIEAIHQEAYSYITKPFNLEEIRYTVKKAVSKYNKSIDQKHIIEDLKEELCGRYNFSNIIGNSSAMQSVFSMMKKVIPVDSTVLITGSSGTGKELVARTIHYNGHRKHKPFVTVDCAALPETLLESELFGHEKGAFTSANKEKKGMFEVAHGGTVFLDEIGETTPAFQMKLLRVLQEGQIKRVGGLEPIQIDVRLIAATNKDLAKMVKESKFREDLFYRLNVITLELPGLRNRTDDIPLLLTHFLKKFNEKIKKQIKSFSQEGTALLKKYAWPGNVRELENIVERAVILCDKETIFPEHLPESLTGSDESDVYGDYSIPDDGISLDKMIQDIERKMIKKALSKSGGVKNRAANLLKMNRTTLIAKMKKLFPE